MEEQKSPLPRQASIEMIRRLPDQCSFDDIMYEINFVAQVCEGLEDADKGYISPVTLFLPFNRLTFVLKMWYIYSSSEIGDVWMLKCKKPAEVGRKRVRSDSRSGSPGGIWTGVIQEFPGHKESAWPWGTQPDRWVKARFIQSIKLLLDSREVFE